MSQGMEPVTYDVPVEGASFTPIDYTIFVTLIVVSIIIGVSSGLRGFSKTTTKDFFVGGREMHPIPVSMSLIGGVISALSVLGNPTEIYLYGTQLWMNLLGAFWGIFVIVYILLPVLYPLDLISLMQFLEMRFQSKALKKLGSLTQLLNISLYLGICLYTPALALSSVTPLPNWLSIVLLGIVCTIYISIGGVKAVVYTDVFQTTVMFIGVLAVIVQVCLDLGGISRLFEIAQNGRRLEFLNFDTSPFTRHTFWSVQILGLYFIVSVVGISQPQFQRLSSVRSLKISQTMCLVFFVGLVALWSLFNTSGLAAYAVYADCDPYKSGKIEKPDQIIPYLVADKLSRLPGMSGLFVAAVYGAVLSSVSSQASSFAALLWEDFLVDCVKLTTFTKLSSTFITRILTAMAGVLGIGLAFLVGSLGTLFQASYSISGAVISPMDGLFITGICAPWVKKKGAICGFLTAFAFNMWLVIGKFLKFGGENAELPLSTSGCNVTSAKAAFSNASVVALTSLTSPATTALPLDSITEAPFGRRENSLYNISYCYLGTIGILIVFFVSTFVSILTGVNDPKDVREDLIFKPSMKFYKWIWQKYKGPLEEHNKPQINLEEIQNE